MRLTTIQFRAVGTNYNQVVKYCTAIFRKAAAYLYKLEKNRLKWRIVPKDYQLRRSLKQKHLKNDS
jgi:hypothetical protein